MKRHATPGSTRSKRAPGPGAAASAPGAAATLALQRGAGNAAVARVLARRQPAKPVARPVQTGLRKPAVVEEFAQKAFRFWQRNPDAPVDFYVRFLAAAANVQLGRLGVPDVRVSIGSGLGNAAGEFQSEFWAVVVNPAHFIGNVKREQWDKAGRRVEKIRDLDETEAGLLAARIFHEARHAEQRFRVARALAAEARGGTRDAVLDHLAEARFGIDEDVAGKAAQQPVKGRLNWQERHELAQWRENLAGADRRYREAVTWWGGELRDLARLLRDVEPGEMEGLRETIVRRIREWAEPAGAAGFIRSHARSAKARGRGRGAAIAREITTIGTAFARVQAAVDRLDQGWARSSQSQRQAGFKSVHDALVPLVRALSRAYHEQPVEADAHAAGDAVFYAFERHAKKARAAG